MFHITEITQFKRNPGSFAPLNDILINSEGNVGLCCYDWPNTHVFGDLRKSTLADILVSEKFKEVYNRLSTGDRFLDICKKCRAVR